MLQLPNRQNASSLMVCQLLPATKLPGAEELEASHPGRCPALAGQLAAAAPPLPLLCAQLAQRLQRILEWPFGLPAQCNKALAEGKGKCWFTPDVFMESCVVCPHNWVTWERLMELCLICAACPALGRWSCWMLFFCQVLEQLPPTFFLVMPKQKRGCVSWCLQTWQLWRTLAWHTLWWWKEHGQTRPPFLTEHSWLGWGELGGSGPLPCPALLQPGALLGLWAPAQTLQCRCPALPGSSCPPQLACNFPASVREKSLGAGQPPATWGSALCAVTVCRSCAWGWQSTALLLLRWVWFWLEVLMRCFMWRSGLQLFKGTCRDLFTAYWPVFIKHVKTSRQISQTGLVLISSKV